MITRFNGMVVLSETEYELLVKLLNMGKNLILDADKEIEALKEKVESERIGISLSRAAASYWQEEDLKHINEIEVLKSELKIAQSNVRQVVDNNNFWRTENKALKAENERLEHLHKAAVNVGAFFLEQLKSKANKQCG